ncbi:MAG: sigma-70 family RNA polymerase sigma factor [Acidobacteriota bacterium]
MERVASIPGRVPGRYGKKELVADEPLMEAVCRGDEKAFEMLVKRYKTPIINYVGGIIRERDRARDVAQETFLKVFRFASRYRPDGSFSTWLYAIATNLAIEELRRKKRRARYFVDSARGDVQETLLNVAPEASPDSRSRLLQDELAARVRSAIHSLPARYRFVVVLRDLQELPYRDIARTTRLRLSTVKTRLNRGRLLLKEKLRSYVEEQAR